MSRTVSEGSEQLSRECFRAKRPTRGDGFADRGRGRAQHDRVILGVVGSQVEVAHGEVAQLDLS